MFFRISVRDVVKIRCYLLDSSSFYQSVEDELQSKYSNKVIPGQGLCVCIRELEQLGEPIIHPGQGHVHIRVRFGVVVFKPCIGQVIPVVIRYCDASGILASTMFFEDIFIPKDQLPDNSEFRPDHQMWVWNRQDSELLLENQTHMNARVLNIVYKSRDLQDPKSEQQQSSTLLEDLTPVMKIVASIKDAGLGPTEWWNDNSTFSGTDGIQIRQRI